MAAIRDRIRYLDVPFEEKKQMDAEAAQLQQMVEAIASDPDGEHDAEDGARIASMLLKLGTETGVMKIDYEGAAKADGKE
ncbi:hypothetical protein A8B82_21065 [Sulfitobacter sp. EhC04]|nr:hypothetical protein A8B82_21065 [Sulfitobacter sp. EhC04]